MPLRRRRQWWGVTLDAPDGIELGRFYARLLDWTFYPADNGLGGAVAPSETAGYNLGFQTEKNYVRPIWPAAPGKPQMSMHLEIEVDDLEEAADSGSGSICLDEFGEYLGGLLPIMDLTGSVVDISSHPRQISGVR